MAKIEKIVLAIGKKTVELSMDEAKELKQVLAEIFGADKIEYVRTDHHHHHDTYPWYPRYWYGVSSGNTLSLSAGDAPENSSTSNWLEQLKSNCSL